MKKVLVLAIALVAVGLVIVPQVQAQDMAKLTQLQAELERIQASASARGGSFTPQEVQRMNEIQQEMMQAMGPYGGMMEGNPSNQQQQPRQQPAGVIQRMVYPGARTGWPAASAFRRYGVTVAQPNIQTKDGVTYSYKTEGEKLIIYISKNFSNSVRATEAQVISANGEVDSLGEFNDTQMLAALNHFERAFGAAISSSVGVGGYGGGFKVQDPTKKNTAARVYQIAVNYDFDVIEGTVPIKIDNISGEHKVQYFKFEIEPHSYNPQDLQ